jgi:hypothetical protein
VWVLLHVSRLRRVVEREGARAHLRVFVLAQTGKVIVTASATAVKPPKKKATRHFNPKLATNYTYPKAITIRERNTRRFDELNLKPEFLPAWYLDLKAKQAAAVQSANIRAEEKRTRDALFATPRPTPPSHKILRHLLEHGPATSTRLFEALQTNFSSRTNFGHCLTGLTRREQVRVVEKVIDKKKVYEFKVHRPDRIRKLLEAFPSASSSAPAAAPSAATPATKDSPVASQ